MVSFAMECFEKGLLTTHDTGGLDLRFGNAEAMVELTRMICRREGLGNVLAEGPRYAVSRIHPDASAFAIQVKNQPLPMHESRTRHGQALGYAVSPTGADHTHNMWDGGMHKDRLGEEWLELGVYEDAQQSWITQGTRYVSRAGSNFERSTINIYTLERDGVELVRRHRLLLISKVMRSAEGCYLGASLYARFVARRRLDAQENEHALCSQSVSEKPVDRILDEP